MRHSILLILPITVILCSCNKISRLTTITCSDSNGVETAKSVISDDVENSFANQKRDDGSRVFDPAAVRATLSKLQISFENIRTSKTDPNSTKVFCAATYKVVVPTDLFKNMNDGLGLMTPPTSLNATATKYNFSVSSNSFNKEIEYSLQPTDDRKSIFSELTDAQSPSNFLQEAIAATLIKPILEAKQANEAKAAADANAENLAQAQQQQELQAQQTQANLVSAQQENALAKNVLNQLWKLTPKDKQLELTLSQSAWVEKKKVDCSLEAASKSTDITQNEVDRLTCDTTRVKQRTEELKQYQANL